MITFLSGTLVEKSEQYAVISVGGVGFHVIIPLPTFRELPNLQSSITLYTYLYLREDEIKLYGFSSKEEREMFEILLGVSGVGAKMAIDAISALPVAQFVRAVQSDETALLCQVPGIGKKRAERLLFDLKNSKHPLFFRGDQPKDGKEDVSPSPPQDSRTAESIEALVALGMTPVTAQQAVAKAVEALGGEADVTTLIKEGLKHR